MKHYLFFDTETTGLPTDWSAPVTDLEAWPRLVQIAWKLCNEDGKEISWQSYIIKPDGFEIPEVSSNIHGITTERAEREGAVLQDVLEEFREVLERADFLVAHNVSFDEKVVGSEFLRAGIANRLSAKPTICTKEISTEFCAIPNTYGYTNYKWPKLSELHQKLFGEDFIDAHNAEADVHATVKCFFKLKEQGIV